MVACSGSSTFDSFDGGGVVRGSSLRAGGPRPSYRPPGRQSPRTSSGMSPKTTRDAPVGAHIASDKPLAVRNETAVPAVAFTASLVLVQWVIFDCADRR